VGFGKNKYVIIGSYLGLLGLRCVKKFKCTPFSYRDIPIYF